MVECNPHTTSCGGGHASWTEAGRVKTALQGPAECELGNYWEPYVLHNTSRCKFWRQTDNIAT